jgi:hypothetical protein
MRFDGKNPLRIVYDSSLLLRLLNCVVGPE